MVMKLFAAVNVLLLVGAVHSSISRQSIAIGRSAHSVSIEQEFEGAEEGSVVWDASRSFLAYISQPPQLELLRDARVLEIGAGTGVVGIALARLGAKSITLTDKHSQIALCQRNAAFNLAEIPGISPIGVEVLCWEPGRWRHECASELAQPDSFDLIVVCDCVYPGQSSAHLAAVLLELLELNPHATILLAFEQRPPPADAPEGTDHPAAFFETMRRSCQVEEISDELDPAWTYEELSVWRMRHHSAGE